MYSLIKKNLLVLAIFALPVMNSSVIAMDDLEYSEKYLRYYASTVESEEAEYESQDPSMLNFVTQKATEGLQELTKHPVAVMAGVWFCKVTVAAACACTCWPDLTSPQYPKMIGEQPDKIHCQNLCWGFNYFKNYTCN